MGCYQGDTITSLQHGNRHPSSRFKSHPLTVSGQLVTLVLGSHFSGEFMMNRKLVGVALICLGLSVFNGCGDDCKPDCSRYNWCGDDGCGGTCGPCTQGRVCGPDYYCVCIEPYPKDCGMLGCWETDVDCGTIGTCDGVKCWGCTSSGADSFCCADTFRCCAPGRLACSNGNCYSNPSDCPAPSRICDPPGTCPTW
jgi:hypothetical protein